MAAATGFAFGHVSHACLAGALAVVILLGMTVTTLIYLYVEIMAEYCIVNWLRLVLKGFSGQAAVTRTAVFSGSKGSLSVVA